MQHKIDPTQFGSRGEAMTDAIQACVHCGFCLAACPTYKVLGEEMDSPRGRIYLMKSVLEEGLTAAEAEPYIDRCLGCVACVPACPSGVAYGDLLLAIVHCRRRNENGRFSTASSAPSSPKHCPTPTAFASPPPLAKRASWCKGHCQAS